MTEPQVVPNAAIPLCVDLDGTLLNSDLLLETVFAQLKRQPLAALHWPRWLAAGKARFKAELAALVDLEIETLPYHPDFLAFLHEQQRQGRPLVLVTAAHRALAEQVAAHLGLFDRVLATEGDRNLAGARKAETLVELYGERGFDYAGNAAVDVAVWKHARRAIVVNASAQVMAQARRQHRSRTGVRRRRIATGAVGQGRAPAPMAQKRPDLRAVGGRPRLERSGETGALSAGVSQLRAVRLQRLSAQRPAGPGRRPPPSPQMPPTVRRRYLADPARRRRDSDPAAGGVRAQPVGQSTRGSPPAWRPTTC